MTFIIRCKFGHTRDVSEIETFVSGHFGRKSRLCCQKDEQIVLKKVIEVIAMNILRNSAFETLLVSYCFA